MLSVPITNNNMKERKKVILIGKGHFQECKQGCKNPKII